MPIEERLWQFPCAIPIKAIGINAVDFEQRVIEIVAKHTRGAFEHELRCRESKGGKYLAVTITITVHSKSQLEAIYRDLYNCEIVLMTL